MSNKATNQDIEFMHKCIKLSEKSLKSGDKPFGCLIVKNNKIIAKASNNSKKRISDHAEIIALNKAHKTLGTSNLSSCTLYSNCEPCPMCSFMIREFKIKKVVFSLHSKKMGGYSRWNILSDKILSESKPFFAKPPKIVEGILKQEAKEVFEKSGLLKHLKK